MTIQIQAMRIYRRRKMMTNLLDRNVIENILTDLGKCQEESGVIMTDAKYVFEASQNLEDRIKDISDRLNKLIETWEERDDYKKANAR